MEQLTYYIYGRKAYANPLKFVGELAILQAEDLQSEALKKFGEKFGEEDWVELVALPTTDILTIIPKAGAA